MLVQPQELAEVWSKVERWIGNAIQEGQGDESALDVLIGIARGVYSLWYEAGAFAAVVQTLKYPRQTVATILYCGGEDIEAIKLAFAFGKRLGAAGGIDVLRVWGREGWERLLELERVGVILQVQL